MVIKGMVFMKENKKSIIIILVILGIVLIAVGYAAYILQKPIVNDIESAVSSKIESITSSETATGLFSKVEIKEQVWLKEKPKETIVAMELYKATLNNEQQQEFIELISALPIKEKLTRPEIIYGGTYEATFIYEKYQIGYSFTAAKDYAFMTISINDDLKFYDLSSDDYKRVVNIIRKDLF